MKRNFKYLTLTGILVLGIGFYSAKFIEQKKNEIYYQVEKSMSYMFNGILDGAFDNLNLERKKFKEKKEFLDEYEDWRNREKNWNVG